VTDQDETPLTPLAAAAVVMTILEGKGAVFTLGADGYLHTELDGIAGLTQDKAEQYATAVMALREEIKTLLRGQRSTH
jgi:hypothetical protein